MTNEEAIIYLEGQRACICSEDCQNNYDYTHCEQGFLCNDVEAINMAIEALKAQDVPEINVGDMISRQGAIDAVKKHYRIDNDLLELIVYEIEQLPSAESKQLKVLANVLDGCPLTQPCDKMWRGGWCNTHCKTHEPNAECWLKYAEVMVNENN